MRPPQSRATWIGLLAALLLLSAPTWGVAQSDQSADRKDSQSERDDAEQGVATGSHVGKVLSVEEGWLKMNIDGREPHTHRINDKTRITLNGKTVEADALRKGDTVRVTTKKDNPRIATRIEATRGQTAESEDEDKSRPKADPSPDRRPFRTPIFPNQPSAQSKTDNDTNTEPQTNTRPWLGLVIRQTTQGVQVEEVFPGGPAARAGFRPGDVLTKVGDTDLKSAGQLRDLIADKEVGDALAVTIQRNGTQGTLDARLGGRLVLQGEQETATSPEHFRDYDHIPPHAMELEMHRRASEQHERLERLMVTVLQELRALRQEVDELKGNKPGTRKNQKSKGEAAEPAPQ